MGNPIREGVGVCDRSGRGIVRLTGPDRKVFLQGMVTNDVAALSPGQGCYALHLSVKGKVLADLTVYVGDEWILCETSEALGPKLARLLGERLVMEDVDVVDETEKFGVVAAYGPRAFEVAGVEPLLAYAHRTYGNGIVAGTGWTGGAGVHWLVPRGEVERLMVQLCERGAVRITADVLALAYIEAGVPRYGIDFGEDTIPLEAGLDHAISFKKGCYVGQEVIARVTARGHMHWRLVKLEIPGNVPPSAGTVTPSGVRITSAAFSPEKGSVLALGWGQAPPR